MKRYLSYLLAAVTALVALSCCASVSTLLKEGKPDEIYAKALEFYRKEKWNRASTLFEGVQRTYLGTSREDSITFYNAHCKFKSHDYETASMLFDEFRRRFGRSAFIEDAEGMYALCFYRMSPSAERDQTTTGKAIIAVNEFMSRYPESERIEAFRAINEELTRRLHKKTYLNAYTYYKIGRYKSAIVALKNALRTYPESDYREELMYLIVDAGYRLASNSIASKQTDRYLAMLDASLSFCEEFPESKHRKEVDRMAAAARDYLDRNKQTEENNMQ